MANSYTLIPFQNVPQEFRYELSGVTYNMRTRWVSLGEYWQIDIYDNATGDPLSLGTAITNGADLLGQLRHLGFVGGLFVTTDGDQFARPDAETLGNESNVFYGVEA